MQNRHLPMPLRLIYIFNLLRLEFTHVTRLFSNHGPLYFVATKRFFSKMGLACHIAKVHSEVIDY